MNQINKLLVQLRREMRPSTYSAICIIDHDWEKGKWIAVPTFWDGVEGSGNMAGLLPDDWVSEYNTRQEASEAVQRLFDEMNISHCPVILVDYVGV